MKCRNSNDYEDIYNDDSDGRMTTMIMAMMKTKVIIIVIITMTNQMLTMITIAKATMTTGRTKIKTIMTTTITKMTTVTIVVPATNQNRQYQIQPKVCSNSNHEDSDWWQKDCQETKRERTHDICDK